MHLEYSKHKSKVMCNKTLIENNIPLRWYDSGQNLLTYTDVMMAGLYLCKEG